MEEQSSKNQESEDTLFAKLAGWLDSRMGLSREFLRPVPAYAINPFYWIGALAVVAFVIEGITGMIMMVYYIPSPTEAYSTTQFIFQSVSYGRFLETVHLYTAYAMIMLSVMHMMRGYFVSVHKKPREIMWVIGMVMGCVTLGMGFTGYLLPWTVVSKSATDVGIGLISALPLGLSNFLNILLVGSGGDSTVLLHFFDLHIVVLPAVLLVCLVAKMYMLETHGISQPASGSESLTEEQKKVIPIFPDVSFYLFELGALFGAAMLLISVIFPVSLPAEYTPLAAAGAVTQPDWYFLWMYQVLKISIFEGRGLSAALGVITLIFVALFVLPFIDRGKETRISRRMKFVTLGAIFVCELMVLSVWGYETPGAVISNEQAVLVVGGTALLVALVSAAVYRLLYRGFDLNRRLQSGKPVARSMQPSSSTVWTSGIFVLLLTTGAITISGTINSVVLLVVGETSLTVLYALALYIAGLAVAIIGTCYVIYRLDLGFGTIKRRVKAFETGWRS